MDYRPFLETHRATGAEVTCAVRTVPLEEAHRFGILELDADGRVVDFIEKPPQPTSNLVSMGVYVFSWNVLREVLSPDRVDFGRDLLPWMVEAGRRVRAYEFKGYWQDVGTVESYWRTSLDLLSDQPEIELNDLGWLIYTRSEERPPARIGARRARQPQHGEPRLRGRGDGRAQHPVAGRAGRAGRHRARLDRHVRHLGGGAGRGRPGDHRQGLPDRRRRRDRKRRRPASRTATSRSACTLASRMVGKRATVPARVTIGRNCRIDPGVVPADFARRRAFGSGETVAHAG